MDLNQLRIFLAVVNCGSFTRAAESLYISHSTTSRSVAALEEALGVRLLHRDNHSVRLTPAGELLYREGKQLLRRVETIESKLRAAVHKV
ncbi:MAG: LysR family transcriptional regulator [Firmicutes bacterium]|nr:LysR family transcriptional regulator [Bacillota bacterium]